MRSTLALAMVCSAVMAPVRVALGQERWTVDARPVLDIRAESASGDHQFHSPAGAVRLRNGTIVVADAHGGMVAFFGKRGELLRSAGREGNGPGEFRHVAWLAQCGGDSVFVWDRMRKRMVVLSGNGDLVREYAIPSHPAAGASSPEYLACSSTGVFVFQGINRAGLRPTGADAPILRGYSPLFLGDRTGSVQVRVDSVWGNEMVVLGGGGGPRPLGKSTSFVVTNDRVYVGTGDSASIDMLDLSGRRLGSIALPVSWERPSAASYAEAVDEIVSNIRSGTRDVVKQLMLKLPMPERTPPYRRLLADPGGLLWLTTSPPGGESTELLAVDPNGSARIRLTIPVPMKVTDVGSDYVLGVHSDADDEPHVLLYRLRRTAHRP